MNQFLRLLNLLGLLFLIACSSKEQNQSVVESKPKIQGIDFAATSTKEVKSISIKNIQLNADKKQEEVSGLTVEFDVELKPEAFDLIKKDDYTGFFIDVKFTSKDGKQLLFRDELFKESNKKKYINSNRDNLVSSFGGRTIEVFFPFRQINLPEGTHDVQVEIAAFPIKYEDNNSSLDMKLMKSLAQESISSTDLKFNLATPKLYNATITVIKAKLDPKLKDPSKYDVALSGKGYPDLFWEVFCGNEYVYYSPVEKNSLQYFTKHTSPTFTFAKEDVINLAMVDYDNGPFNTQDDIIGTKKFKAEELNNSIDTLQFGKLDYIIIQSTIEKLK